MTARALIRTALLIMFLAAFSAVRADTIVLKSGKQIEGRILSRDAKAVIVELYGVTEMSYDLSDIASINGESLSGAVPAATAPADEATGMFSPVRPPAPSAAVMDDSQILAMIEAKALKQPETEFKSKIVKKAVKTGWKYRLLFQFIGYIYFSLCLYRVANRLHDDNSARAWLPGLNIYLMFDIAAITARWVWIVYAMCCGFLMFPLIALTGITGLLTVIGAWLYIVVMTVIAWMRIAANIGKPAWLGLLTIVPVVNLFVLGYFAFSDSRHEIELV